MRGLLWLVPLMPFAGFVLLALAGSRLSQRAAAFVGAGSAAASAVAAALVSFSFTRGVNGHSLTQTLWTWFRVGEFHPQISFCLDPLSMVMTLVITFVGSLIIIYSVEFMREEEGFSRFLAYMDLFICSMTLLVLADNMLLLYLGWEGVGLCSYLLIGFWYKDPSTGYAARKAFVVTRIGDAALAVGLVLLFSSLGTLDISEIMLRAQQQWTPGSDIAVIAAALLLAGALGKSAQLPLQTWLPDAMAGPTPVSALIHAATMVTAGVYLVARTHTLFILAPVVQSAVAVIGGLTLLIAGLSALAQRDIKRVLAYSTISQVGYMFLALGVGAWTAAIFHFMTHAFFKALLFLAAGAVIFSLDHEHDITRMGGLRRRLPATFWTFLAGAASLSALPLVTAGFYSKDMILWLSWSSERGGLWPWLAGVAGAFITSLYAFRLVFLVFFGEERTAAGRRPGLLMTAPLIALAVLSLTSGFIEMPDTLPGRRLFSAFLSDVLPADNLTGNHGGELLLQAIASAASVSGIYLAWLLFIRNPHYTATLVQGRPGRLLQRLWLSGWGFDWLYDRLIVRPFVVLTRVNRDDFIDLIYEGTAWYSEVFHRALSLTQSGSTRLYALAIAAGAMILISLAVFA